MPWLIALAGAAVDLAAALFLTVGGLYAIGPGTNRGAVVVGTIALIAALSGPVCAYLALRAASRGQAAGRVLAVVAVPPAAAAALAALASLLESFGVRIA